MQHCRDLGAFYRRWAASDGAGLVLSRALPSLGEGAVGPIQDRIRILTAAVESGELSLREHSDGFSGVEVAFINVGVATGRIDTALNSLADMYEADYRTVLRIKRKATYPMMVSFCACWIPTFPIAFFGGVLAWIVVGTLLTAAVFTLGGIGLWRYFVWIRSTPRWSQIRFFWALSTAIEAGIHFDEALQLSAKVAAPSKLSDCLCYAAPKGRPIAELLRNSGAFDAAALTMIESGETAGRLPESLRQAANYMEGGIL
jgi:type II secretory pathway component PulF